MPVPRVRVVVVNYNGGVLVERCVEALLATDWPSDRFEVVVVDNASVDGSADRLADRFPGVRLVRSGHNLGFAGGNNLALADLRGVDYVALVNPDAFVEPTWLEPLVTALESDHGLGAANPKLLLEPRFAEVEVSAEPFRPGGADPRTLGVAFHGIRSGEADRWDATVFGEGFYDVEAAPGDPHFRWTDARARLWLPVPGDDRDTAPKTVAVEISAERDKTVTFATGETTVDVACGPLRRWVELSLGGPFVDLLNDAGSEFHGVYAANRGLGRSDDGAFDEATDVVAWTASVVLLARRYLDDVGLFDDRFFMYYEDYDLSLRGRLRGWRYRYVPASRARHIRGAVAGQRSALTDHHVQRNGLLALVKSAPAGVALRELGRYVRDTWTMLSVEVWRPLLRRRRPHPHVTRRRLAVLASFARLLPATVAARYRVGRRARTPRASLFEPVGSAPDGPA